MTKSAGSNTEAAIRAKLKGKAGKYRQITLTLAPEQVAVMTEVTGIPDPETAMGEMIQDALNRYVRIRFLENLTRTKGSPEKIPKKSGDRPSKKTQKKRA